MLCGWPHTSTSPCAARIRRHTDVCDRTVTDTKSAGQRGLGLIWKAPPTRFERAHTAPEAVALSPELRGLQGGEKSISTEPGSAPACPAQACGRTRLSRARVRRVGAGSPGDALASRRG